jgi:hypothetical protein
VRPCGRICPPHEARNRVSMPSGCQVLPRHALEDGRHLLDSPMPPDHDEDAWEIKFPITYTMAALLIPEKYNEY